MPENFPRRLFADDGDLLYIRGKYKIYNMDENELKEALKELEEQGWNPMICDTPCDFHSVQGGEGRAACDQDFHHLL